MALALKADPFRKGSRRFDRVDGQSDDEHRNTFNQCASQEVETNCPGGV